MMNVSIFISSTFNDMHAERDYIRKKVIPKLIDELAQYQVNIQVTDLRWGVNTLTVDEGEREAKVLHVCVDALQNTKPYFIALLGERYGWVPSIEKIKMVKSSLSSDLQTTLGDLEHTISVTEMEIRLGAIGKDSLLNHSFFCFRNYESYEGMTVIEKQEYIDRGYFEVVEGTKENSTGVIAYKTTRVLGKGQVYIINKLLKEQKE